MKRFKCTVERTDEYIIEFDENVINSEFLEDFKKHFYGFKTLNEHAKHIAQVRARLPDTTFIEGYGSVKVNGEVPFSFRKDIVRDDCEDAINIKVVSEDNNINIDVEELK